MAEGESRRDPESSEPAGAQNRAALVVNTRSRNGERAFFLAIDRLQELDIQLGATYAIRDPTRLPETVREILDDGYEFLILGGGDGSVSSVVDFLANREVVFGLLPLGTANDFARTLEIPEDIEGACQAIARGKIVDVDLGLASGNYYASVASVGLGVEATQALSPWLKKAPGRWRIPWPPSGRS
jgi:diacylglycerol kinase family enzyme